jgi:hypothetical protein
MSLYIEADDEVRPLAAEQRVEAQPENGIVRACGTV